MPTDAPRTARARARLELTGEIKRAARQRLAADGAPALSLRGVARDIGMVSSAVYRYFPSREDLLTALIVESYTSLGAVAASAEAAVRRTDTLGRWMAVAKSVRGWALENPHEHELIFGTPVPGYRAPQDTVDPAGVIPLLLLTVLSDAGRHGSNVSWMDRSLPKIVRIDLQRLRDGAGIDLSDATLNQAIVVWTLLVGTISFELFGHLTNVITDFSAYFENQMRNIGLDLGLSRST